MTLKICLVLVDGPWATINDGIDMINLNTLNGVKFSLNDSEVNILDSQNFPRIK